MIIIIVIIIMIVRWILLILLFLFLILEIWIIVKELLMLFFIVLVDLVDNGVMGYRILLFFVNVISFIESIIKVVNKVIIVMFINNKELFVVCWIINRVVI